MGADEEGKGAVAAAAGAGNVAAVAAAAGAAAAAAAAAAKLAGDGGAQKPHHEHQHVHHSVYHLYTSRRKAVFLLVCAVSMLLVPISDTIYLPALPAVTKALNTTPQMTALTVAVYMYCVGAGALFAGPVADRFGRKRTLLGATLLNGALSVACMFPPSVEGERGHKLGLWDEREEGIGEKGWCRVFWQHVQAGGRDSACCTIRPPPG